LDVEASIVPLEIRLNNMQRRYALRALYLDKNHPIRIRAPDSYLPEDFFGREVEGSKYLEWVENKTDKRTYNTTIDLILARINFLVIYLFI